MWRSWLENLESAGTLKIWHILSQSDENWEGLKGRVSKDILNKCTNHSDKKTDNGSTFYICGPDPFVESALR